MAWFRQPSKSLWAKKAEKSVLRYWLLTVKFMNTDDVVRCVNVKRQSQTVKTRRQQPNELFNRSLAVTVEWFNAVGLCQE